MSTAETTCPVCRSALRPLLEAKTGDAEEYDCPRCGRFGLGGSAGAELPTSLASKPKLGFVVTHAIRRMQRGTTRPLLDHNLLKRLEEMGRLPSPAAQAENLLLWLGDALLGPGERIRISEAALGAILGTGGEENFFWLVKSLLSDGLVEGSQNSAGAVVTLSFSGWQTVETIRRGRGESTKAFMAMKYGDEVLNGVVDQYFRFAVKQTGFVLEPLSDRPRAGLIDDHLRVEIRLSKFLIADLTHENPGAYWEAGFAEGLGKPVIYTCEKTVFKEKKTHFDTNHHLTVTWDKANLSDAANSLKATIRATLPAEAKLTDE